MNSNVVLIAALILVKVLVIGVRHANAHDNSLFYNPPQSHGYNHSANCALWNGCNNNYELKKNWGGYDLYDNNGKFLKSFNTWSMGW